MDANRQNAGMANAALVARRTVLAVVASACLVGPARSPGPSHTRTARARRDVDPWSISRVDSPTSSVALTFDDGPDPDYTPDVLRILAAAQVHATFFVIGRNAREYPELIAAILDGGHEIGNHTQDHVWLDGVPPVEVRRQLVEGSRSIAGAAATWRPDGAIGHGASRHDDGSLPAPNPKDTPWLRPAARLDESRSRQRGPRARPAQHLLGRLPRLLPVADPAGGGPPHRTRGQGRIHPALP